MKNALSIVLLLTLFFNCYSQDNNKYSFRVRVRARSSYLLGKEFNCLEHLPLYQKPHIESLLKNWEVLMVINDRRRSLNHTVSMQPAFGENKDYYYLFDLSRQQIQTLKDITINGTAKIESKLDFVSSLTRESKTDIAYFLRFDELIKITTDHKTSNKGKSVQKARNQKATYNLFSISPGELPIRWELKCPMIINPPAVFSLSLFNETMLVFKRYLDSVIAVRKYRSTPEHSNKILRNITDSSGLFIKRYFKAEDYILLSQAYSYMLEMDTSWVMHDMIMLHKAIDYYSSSKTDTNLTFSDAPSGYALTINTKQDTTYLRSLLTEARRNKDFLSFFKTILSHPIVYTDTINRQAYLLAIQENSHKNNRFHFLIMSNLFRIARINDAILPGNPAAYVQNRNLNLLLGLGVSPFRDLPYSKVAFTVGTGLSSYNTDSSTSIFRVRATPAVSAGIMYSAGKSFLLGISAGHDFIGGTKYYGIYKQKHWWGLTAGISL